MHGKINASKMHKNLHRATGMIVDGSNFNFTGSPHESCCNSLARPIQMQIDLAETIHCNLSKNLMWSSQEL
jgi:hypothetical protein